MLNVAELNILLSIKKIKQQGPYLTIKYNTITFFLFLLFMGREKLLFGL